MQTPRGLAPVLVLTVAMLTVGPGPANAVVDAGDAEDTGAFGAATRPVAGVTGPIDEVVAPVNGAPAFHLAGQTLRVELASEPQAPIDQVRLEPSFGDGDVLEVPVEQGKPEASTLWEGPYERTVIPLTGQLPGEAPEGLYDVVVPDIDRAHRAVSVHEAWPETPTLVLLADTQTGDPRALRDGMQGSFGIDPLAPGEADPRVPPDPGPMNEALAEAFGVDVVHLDVDLGDRWGAYRAAIERVNALEPDLVLFSGDLTFGQLVPGSYHVEYEEAWALINGGTGVDGTTYEGFHAPTLVSPGNHDAYVQSGEDGFAFWEAYFGPPAYSVSFGGATFVSVNTYDWSELDRMAISFPASAWGGQIREDQLAWLRGTLCEANGGTPTEDPGEIAGVGCSGAGDERVITFSHHSPSWVQDTWQDAYDGLYHACPCEGTPVAEQAARGAISYTTTGQAWSGENRLALRETLRDFDVDLHAAGHTHRDRIARDLGDGTIVETPQVEREDAGWHELHLVQPDGEAEAIGFEQGAALMRGGQGPLYIETTTTASSTDEYFGYRPVAWHPGPAAFPEDARGIAPFETGFPMTEALLEALANEPSHFNARHTELGLFSTPTFLEDG